jgi:hypothetical protein
MKILFLIFLVSACSHPQDTRTKKITTPPETPKQGKTLPPQKNQPFYISPAHYVKLSEKDVATTRDGSTIPCRYEPAFQLGIRDGQEGQEQNWDFAQPCSKLMRKSVMAGYKDGYRAYLKWKKEQDERVARTNLDD